MPVTKVLPKPKILHPRPEEDVKSTSFCAYGTYQKPQQLIAFLRHQNQNLVYPGERLVVEPNIWKFRFLNVEPGKYELVVQDMVNARKSRVHFRVIRAAMVGNLDIHHPPEGTPTAHFHIPPFFLAYGVAVGQTIDVCRAHSTNGTAHVADAMIMQQPSDNPFGYWEADFQIPPAYVQWYRIQARDNLMNEDNNRFIHVDGPPEPLPPPPPSPSPFRAQKPSAKKQGRNGKKGLPKKG